jgi:type IV pilus biogenesis protein CpaD/CtpE
MKLFKTIQLPRATAFALLLLSAIPLSGCALDQLTADETLKPYGGSKQHPIKVANGRASVEGCGDWSEDVVVTESNELMPNHGCAVQSNIAAMAAYPNDLVKARRMSRAPAFNRMPPNAAPGASGGAAPSAAP